MNARSIVDILLVEDSPEDAELTLRALKKHNLSNRVEHVKDGAAALDYIFGTVDGSIEAPLPTIVLLDLKMPKLSGIDVLKRIREDQRTCRLPVVMLTSSREDRDLDEAYSLGVNSYIVKPIDFADFVRTMAQVGMYWALLNEKPLPRA